MEFWKNKKVLITGDTGFKGSWLTCLLLKLGSYVHGVSLKPDSSNYLYNLLISDHNFNNIKEQKFYNHYDLDIRKGEIFKELILDIKPDVIFHLAAQPLVRESYIYPKLTWETNVMGTINLLEGIRDLKKCSVVIITTDKVYENKNWQFAYRENDHLGGNDPYSSSKAAVEIAVKSWKKSFFDLNIPISTARAGNVIGGGDWAKNRIVPDVIKSLINNEILELRYPKAVRPWQHVLDPLYGYLVLAEKQLIENINNSYNFGPNPLEITNVEELVKLISDEWGSKIEIKTIQNQPLESSYLTLSIEQTVRELKWEPKWHLKDTINQTVNWYKNINLCNSAFNCINENIESYLYPK